MGEIVDAAVACERRATVCSDGSLLPLATG
jgi:hypothetical protein